MPKPHNSRNERLYLRSYGIKHEHNNGHWLPIVESLANRHHTDAMTDLADWLGDGCKRKYLVRPSVRASVAGLYYRAYRLGNSRAAGNLAVYYFNLRNMQAYRHWLRKAANIGDQDAAHELKRFETRLPHETARKIGRKRPWRKSDYE